MKIKVLATGSKGNCYLLEHNGRILVLDAGIPYKDIVRGTGYKPQLISGVIVTHNHTDHSYSASEMETKGFKVWRPYLMEKNIRGRKFGEFLVTSFDVEHDGEPCVGYIIKVGGRTIFYATDFEVIKYDFRGLNITDMLIEVNYTDDMLDENEYKYSHVLVGHAELNTTKRYIEVHNSENLQNVILVHASAGLDTAFAEGEIRKVTNARVLTAVKGLEVIL
jgi:phosphoribosyl 1,2-cyclic phosphodiesterase